MIEVIANSVDEAFDKLDESEVIEEMLKTQNNSISVEFGECKPYIYKGTDDCEYFMVGEFEVTDDDISIDWFEIACELFEELNRKDKK